MVARAEGFAGHGGLAHRVVERPVAESVHEGIGLDGVMQRRSGAEEARAIAGADPFGFAVFIAVLGVPLGDDVGQAGEAVRVEGGAAGFELVHEEVAGRVGRAFPVRPLAVFAHRVVVGGDEI